MKINCCTVVDDVLISQHLAVSRYYYDPRNIVHTKVIISLVFFYSLVFLLKTGDLLFVCGEFLSSRFEKCSCIATQFYQ